MKISRKDCLLNAVDQVLSPVNAVAAGQQSKLGDELISELSAQRVDAGELMNAAQIDIERLQEVVYAAGPSGLFETFNSVRQSMPVFDKI